MRINTADAGPLVWGGNVSEMDAEGTASTGDQQNPAMNLQKHRAPKLCVNPAPRVNRQPRGIVKM
jgi:hypothetical protein